MKYQIIIIYIKIIYKRFLENENFIIEKENLWRKNYTKQINLKENLWRKNYTKQINLKEFLDFKKEIEKNKIKLEEEQNKKIKRIMEWKK